MTLDSFGDQLGTILSTPSTAPPIVIVIGTAIAAGVIAITGTQAKLFIVVSTIIHEAGHAAGAILTGGGVHLIQIHAHDSGNAYTWYSTQASRVITMFAGYACPALAGLGIAALIDAGHAPVAVFLVVLLMFLILIVTRDLLTFGIIVTIGVLAAALLWWGPVWLQTWIATALAWLLLFGEGPHLVSNSISYYRHGYDGLSDADNLADYTGFPVFLWLLGWFTVMGGCIWLAAPLLWP